MIKSAWKLQLRLAIVSMIMFGMVFVILAIAGNLIGLGGSVYFYFILALGITFIQYLAGPKMVEMSMGVRYVSESEFPELHQMVEELAHEANLPKPKVAVSSMSVPNAFAYGRTKRDGHVCVTSGIMGLLDKEELKAVLGHEMSHIKHNDMMITTIISVIPLICYYVGISSMFSSNDDNGGGLLVILGIAGYFIGQLLVLAVSRIREYYADEGSVQLGCKPEKLASALYKLVYGAARCPERDIKEVEGSKAFFLNDVSNAGKEITRLNQLDLNNDGVIGADELEHLRNFNININTSTKFTEALSTLPDMLKRIKKLAELQEEYGYQ